MTKAVEYFEKSDKLGSIDAAYNLGYMYHTGKYPGKDRDMASISIILSLCSTLHCVLHPLNLKHEQ